MHEVTPLGRNPASALAPAPSDTPLPSEPQYPPSHSGGHKPGPERPWPRARRDRRGSQWHGRIGVVVAGSTEKTVLADRRVRAKRNPLHTVTIHLMTQATVRAHGQIPRRPNLGRGIGVRTRTNGRVTVGSR